MSARKSLPRHLRRLSRLSVHSQVSGVLDPDSDVNSDDEADPLWFKEFENNSMGVRQSALFNSVQSDTPILDSNSELESTPLQKNWWEDLEDTPDVRQRRKSNVLKEKSNVTEKSNLESSSDTSVLEDIVKRRFARRRDKRKSIQKNVFSDILDSTKDNDGSEKIIQSSENRERRISSDISHTDTDISVEKVRRVTFKKKKQTKLINKPSNVESKSDGSRSDVFKDALDSPSPIDVNQIQDVAVNQPRSPLENPGTPVSDSVNSVETMRLELSPEKDLSIEAEDARDTTARNEEFERSRSPVLMSRSKKRSIFTKTMKRKSANFDALLDDESVEDQPSNRGEFESSRSEIAEELNAPKNPKRRMISTKTMQRKSANFDALLDDESVEDQPSHRGEFESNRSEIAEGLNASGNPKRRTISTKTIQRKSANFDALLDDESVEDQPSNRGEFESEGNEIGVELNASKNPKRRTISTKTIQRKSANFDALLDDESVEDQPSNKGEFESAGNEMREEFTAPKNPKRRTISTKTIQRKSANFDALLDDVSVEDQPSHSGEFGSNRSEIGEELNASKNPKRRTISTKTIQRNSSNLDALRDHVSVEDQPSHSAAFGSNRNEIDSPNRVSAQESDSDMEDSIKKQRVPFGSQNRRSRHDKTFEQILETPNISIRSEPTSARKRTGKLDSSRKEGPWSDIERRSSKRKSNLAETSSGANFEVEDQSVRKQSRLSRSRSIVDRQSTNQKNDHHSRTVSTDEEEDDEEGSIDQTEKSPEFSKDSRSQTRNANTTESTVPVHLSDKHTNQKKKTLEVPSKQNKSHVAHSTDNTENGESQSTGVGTTTRGVKIGPDTSFSFTDHDGSASASAQQADTSPRVKSQGFSERLTQMKNQLDEVKRKEFARMKNTKIDTYFKKTSSTNPSIAANKLQRVPVKTKPLAKQNKTATTPPDKAYLVNGKVYQRPKLPRPKQWATDRLYNYLWKKMEPKYKLKTRIRSEKFIIYLSDVVALVVRRKKYDNYRAELESLIHEMARLKIINTRNDFNIFCQNFLHHDFRIKVIPMILPGNERNIPFKPEELHTPIMPL